MDAEKIKSLYLDLQELAKRYEITIMVRNGPPAQSNPEDYAFIDTIIQLHRDPSPCESVAVLKARP